MEDQFELDIQYQGKQIIIPVRLYTWGYTYRLEAPIDGVQIFFEPDENGSYRAVIEDTVQIFSPRITELTEAIITQLESLRS